MLDDDDDDDDTKEPDVWSAPPAETLQALDEQYTAKVAKDAHRYAEYRANLVRRAGRAVPNNYARELVQDAHADTWLGRVTWHPERCALIVHLRGVIYDRTWAEIRRATRYPHFSIDAPANDRAWSIDRAEVEQALAEPSRHHCSPVVVYAWHVRTCAELRRLASGDREALDLLWCWEQSILDRDEVMAITGLDEAAYQRVRKRLLYVARNLPPELREAAQDQLRSAS
jgi:hypothetical protein